MKELQQFKDVAEEFRNDADFVIIYIEEAHASNKWTFFANAEYIIEEHTDLNSRKDAALMLAEAAPKIPIYLDLMDDNACKAYGALPERLYILNDGKVAYQGKFTPFFYSVQEVEDWLKQWREKKK